MARAGVHLIGRERTFPKDEIIVSKTDTKGRLTYVNDVFLHVSGYTEEELVGQPHGRSGGVQAQHRLVHYGKGMPTEPDCGSASPETAVVAHPGGNIAAGSPGAVKQSSRFRSIARRLARLSCHPRTGAKKGQRGRPKPLRGIVKPNTILDDGLDQVLGRCIPVGVNDGPRLSLPGNEPGEHARLVVLHHGDIERAGGIVVDPEIKSGGQWLAADLHRYPAAKSERFHFGGPSRE